MIIKQLIGAAEFKREFKGCVESSKIKQGWNESFDKLAEYLETDKSIISRENVPQFELPSDWQVVITRIFDAPRELVFR